MDFNKMIDDISNRVPQESGGNDYVKDGILHCGLCGTPKQCVIEIGGQKKKVNCLCRCASEAYAAKEKRNSLRRFEKITNKRRDICFKYDKYKNTRFENAEKTDLIKFFMKRAAVFKKGDCGALAGGGVGTGKTYAAACLANELLEKGFTCLMRTPSELEREYGSCENRQKFFEKIGSFDVLILDDFGSERETSYMREVVFDVINTRYLSNKTLFVTTNLSAEDFKNPETDYNRRIYSRLFEMCRFTFTGGSDRRVKILTQRAKKENCPASDKKRRSF